MSTEFCFTCYCVSTNWPGLSHHGRGLVQQLGLMVCVEGSGVGHVVQNVTAHQSIPAVRQQSCKSILTSQDEAMHRQDPIIQNGHHWLMTSIPNLKLPQLQLYILTFTFYVSYNSFGWEDRIRTFEIWLHQNGIPQSSSLLFISAFVTAAQQRLKLLYHCWKVLHKGWVMMERKKGSKAWLHFTETEDLWY